MSSCWDRLSRAEGFLSRAVGLIPASWAARRARAGATGATEVGALLIPRCSCIHTYWMAMPMDLAFIGTDGLVLAAERAVAPWRLRRSPGASCVLERLSCDRPWPVAGERVDVLAPGDAARRACR